MIIFYQEIKNEKDFEFDYSARLLVHIKNTSSFSWDRNIVILLAKYLLNPSINIKWKRKSTEPTIFLYKLKKP